MHLALFFAALFFSTMGSLAGFGGGIFMIPLMIIGFDIPADIAIGVAAMSLFPSSLLTSLLNLRKKVIDFRLLIALEIPAVIGAYAGAHLTNAFPLFALEICFATFLFFISWKVLRPARKETVITRMVGYFNTKKPLVVKSPYVVSLWSATFFGATSGALAGLFGIGGGIIKTPIMINVFKVPIKTATATAVGTIVFTSMVSGATHYKLGHVVQHLVVPTALGFVLGAIAGYVINIRIHESTIRNLIAASIFLAGGAVLLHTLF
jgi:uncharacterized protein